VRELVAVAPIAAEPPTLPRYHRADAAAAASTHRASAMLAAAALCLGIATTAPPRGPVLRFTDKKTSVPSSW